MTDQPDFTPRNVAKMVVTATIQLKTAALTQTAIADHTSYEADAIPVRIVGGVVGWGVSQRVKPHTDRMVDKTANFVTERRAKRQAKKAEKETTK